MAGHKTVDRYRVFTLRIEGVNIENLNLDDIGQYLTDFAQLLGKDAEPKYHSIRKGSLNIAAKVPLEHVLDVKTRGFLLRTGDAPEDALRAEQRISRRLGIHHARRATVLDPKQQKLIEIPIEQPTSELALIPTITRPGSLQGQIIRIGGKLDIVTVELQDVDGHVYSCKAKRDKARALAHEIFGPTVRVNGTGKWKRTEGGEWFVEDFQISDFEVLDDAPLGDVLREVHQIHSKWQEQDDPHAEIARIRNGE